MRCQENVKLSIIVPIFNAAQYIDRCVRSLMEQTLARGVEYILINDASTDHSVEILERIIDEYPERQNQIRVIHHEQTRGIAATRTHGIKEARGVYIGWCDSDDWCEPQMFSTMLQKAEQENADIVTCGYFCDTETYSSSVLRIYPSSGKEYLKKLYTYPDTFCSMCDKIVRRSLFINNNIYPFSDVNVSEDMNTMYRIFFYAQRVYSLTSYFYHINSTEHPSISHNKDKKYIFDQNCRNNTLLCEFLQSKGPEDYHLSCSYLIFLTKLVSADVFEDSLEYFHFHQETHKDILHFMGKPLLLRLKLALCFSCYPMYLVCSSLIKLRDRMSVFPILSRN